MRKQSIPLLQTICLLILLVGSSHLFAQSTDYFMKSSDDELTVQVSREETKITIALYFSAASKYEYVVVERSADSQNSFSQCKYIRFNDSANDRVMIVERDMYPLALATDIFYRVKTFTKDGATRIYPSVRLPGMREKEKQ